MRGRGVAAGACAVALGLSTLAVVGPAQAGSKYAVQEVNGQTLRWNPCQTEVTYQVNVKAVGAKKAQKKALREVKKSFTKLSAATGIRFSYQGKTSQMPSGDDWFQKQGPSSEIVVAYAKRSGSLTSDLLPAGAWGIGGTVYKTWGAGQTVIGAGYVVLDSARAKKLDNGFGRGLTRGNLVLHELGHVMGLDHTSDRKQLMYPTLTSRSPDGFARGDKAGLTRVGAQAGCIDVPSYVFEAS